MKKKIISLTVLITMVFAIYSCSSNKTDNNNDLIDQDELIDSDEGYYDADVDYTENMVEAKFEFAQCMEGECEFVFELDNGDLIYFHKNYIQPDGYELDYDFFDQDEFGPNKDLVGKTFIINYKVESIYDMNSEENIDVNIITDIKLN